MTTSSAFHEYVWNGVLSRDRQRIIKTFLSLDEESRNTVIEHLVNMTSESGWHPEQKKSAQITLDALPQRNT